MDVFLIIFFTHENHFRQMLALRVNIRFYDYYDYYATEGDARSAVAAQFSLVRFCYS